jgi:hypothetical protein
VLTVEPFDVVDPKVTDDPGIGRYEILSDTQIRFTYTVTLVGQPEPGPPGPGAPSHHRASAVTEEHSEVWTYTLTATTLAMESTTTYDRVVARRKAM